MTQHLSLSWEFFLLRFRKVHLSFIIFQFHYQSKPSKSEVLMSTKRIEDKTKNDKRSNEGKKVFHLCSFCKRSFKNMADLKIHIKRHQNVLPMAMIGRAS